MSHHSLPSRVADVHGQLHRDRHRRDDQAVSEKEEDVDGHLINIININKDGHLEFGDSFGIC